MGALLHTHFYHTTEVAKLTRLCWSFVMLPSHTGNNPEAIEMDQNQNAFRAQLDCIQIFGALPDDALVDLKTVSTLASRSRSSIYRDIRLGYFVKPLRIGKISSRWRVEDVRAYLNGN